MKPKLLTTLPGYSLEAARGDALAGVTVAMVAIPLSIAIAIASGAPPATGLVTAIIGGLLISLLGGSRVQIGGPTGAFIVVVYLIAHVPEAVVNGFTIGIGIIIASSQLKDFLGLTADHVPADFLPKVASLWAARHTLNPIALETGLAALVLIVAMRRLFPRLPGLIVAIGLVSGAVWALHLPVDSITSRYGALPARLPMPALPSFSLSRVEELLPSALVIAFLAAIESLLSAMVADRLIGASHRPNAEILAQGWANIGSALFGGLPATGALARTATNVGAGGRTPIAGIVHAGVILLVLLFAAPLAGYMVMPALAALLLSAAWNMTEPRKWRHYWSQPLADRALLVITLALTVLSNLTIAIGVGVGLGLALRLLRPSPEPEHWSEPEH